MPTAVDEPLEIATKGMFTRNMFMDAQGVRRGRARVAWGDVGHYRYALADWRKRGDFPLFAAGGAPLLVIEPIFDHWEQAAEQVLAHLHPRLRAARYFHPFGLTDAALTHAGRPDLPLAAIDHVELAAIGYAVGVFVHARDGSEWARADIGDVANLWLFVEALLARDVGVRSELDFHLPPALAPLTAALAAARALPVATVVR